MGLAERIVDRVQLDYMDQVEAFFEPQLVKLGLGKDQINRLRSPDRLQRALDKVDDAITDPSSFGTLRLKMDPTGRMG